MKSNFKYNETSKYFMQLRFKDVNSSEQFAWDYDVETVDKASDWVYMCFDKKSDLNKFIKIAINDENVKYFEVTKRSK